MTDQQPRQEKARDKGLGKELVHWAREGLRDLGQELQIALVFLGAMVPAGVVGYLLAGVEGAFYGAVAGAALLVAAMVLSVGWSLARRLRRR